MRKKTVFIFVCCAAVLLFTMCAKPPIRQYYMLNYNPEPLQNRLAETPYPYVIRLREFSVEEAYGRPQIVYRRNPYELHYYNYRLWAVKPTRMVTDLLFKHLNTANLTNSVVRRLDEGRRPDYELTGLIEALEEYDSDDLLFAHIAMRVNLTKLSDGSNIYSRHFDLRKKVYSREPEFIIREKSLIIEYIFNHVIHDIDSKLAAELSGVKSDVPDLDAASEPVIIEDADLMK